MNKASKSENDYTNLTNKSNEETDLDNRILTLLKPDRVMKTGEIVDHFRGEYCAATVKGHLKKLRKIDKVSYKDIGVYKWNCLKGNEGMFPKTVVPLQSLERHLLRQATIILEEISDRKVLDAFWRSGLAYKAVEQLRARPEYRDFPTFGGYEKWSLVYLNPPSPKSPDYLGRVSEVYSYWLKVLGYFRSEIPGSA